MLEGNISADRMATPGAQGESNQMGIERDTAIDPEAPHPDGLLVSWDDPENKDQANPLNWPRRRKWSIIAVLSTMTFLTPLASSMFAPGVPQVQDELNNHSAILATFVVSVFVLGFAVGPLLLAPLSEMYGRTVVYHVCNIAFTVFTVACALASSMNMLVAFRFLAGFAGVAVVACGSGNIADMMPREERGRAMAIWSMGPLLGPMIGPVAGGFLVDAKGWRWTFWVVAICAAATTLLAFVLLRESYSPVILERKAQRLRKSTGNNKYRSKYDTGESHRQLLLKALARPMKMLLFSPVVALMSIYVGVMYGLLYILFTTFTFVYGDQYGFTASLAGLSFLGAGVGTILGLFFVGSITDQKIKRAVAVRGSAQPEDRLPFIVVVPAALLIPTGIFIYGWGADKTVHWIVPMIGNGITGFGTIAMLMCIQTYLVDAFTIHAASVIAANAVFRSLLGALLPLCGLEVYNALGLGWGNSLLAFIALFLAPIPIVFRVFGQRIREHPWSQVKF